jgi:hypothetical protein
MPRYYLQLTDGEERLSNHKGIDLPGNAAARTDALELARGLKHGAAMPGWDWTGWFVAILDEHRTQGRRGADRGCLIPVARISLRSG